MRIDHSSSRARLLAELRTHALVIGEVVLTSGARAQYLVDAKRAILLPAGFRALADLVAEQARAWGATAVGGMTMGADPIACAALAGGADVKAFFVRKEAKQHGLARLIEGPLLEPGERCMLVEDVVTTGGSTIRALEALREEGHEVCGVLAICDRLAGGAARIGLAAGAPFVALSTIDEIYPDRPDRAELAAESLGATVEAPGAAELAPESRGATVEAPGASSVRAPTAPSSPGGERPGDS